MNLTSVFFAPNFSKMFPYMVESYKSFKFSSDANPYNIAMRIISKYYNDYLNEDLSKGNNFNRLNGDFNLKLMIDEIEIFCKQKRLLEMFTKPNYFLSPSKQNIFKSSDLNIDEASIFAVCTSKKVLSITDNDCFLTPGGCKVYAGTDDRTVYLSLNPYHGIFILVPSYLIYENYNNNFAGVKLSGGESHFEKSGEPKLRAIKTNSYSFIEVLEQFELELNQIDLNKGIEILKDYNF